MCLDCGCQEPLNDHGDPRHLTLDALTAAAAASGIDLAEALANINQTVQRVYELGSADPVAKAEEAEEQRFVLGIAYQAGKDERIAKGVDAARDYITAPELERACWSFLTEGPLVGAFHQAGTTGQGLAQIVESGIYRNPVPWHIGPGLVAKAGDWLLGGVLNQRAWDAVKAGKISGWSPQGVAMRRRFRRSAA